MCIRLGGLSQFCARGVNLSKLVGECGHEENGILIAGCEMTFKDGLNFRSKYWAGCLVGTFQYNWLVLL